MSLRPNQCVCGEYGKVITHSGKTARLRCPKCGDEWAWVNPDSLEKMPCISGGE